MSEYKEYLKSEEWKEKRKTFLELAGHECQNCGAKHNLQIHHKTYENIYDEEFDDIEVLCCNCHKNREIEKGKSLQDKEYGEW